MKYGENLIIVTGAFEYLCLVYLSQDSLVVCMQPGDLCDSDYFGFTARQLHQRIAGIVEHKNSAIGKHFLTAHGDTSH